MSVARLLTWTVGLAVLFVVLSPGVLLTLPAGEQGVLTLNKAPIVPVLVHAAVFAAVYFVVKMVAGRARKWSTSSTSKKSSKKSSVKSTVKTATSPRRR